MREKQSKKIGNIYLALLVQKPIMLSAVNSDHARQMRFFTGFYVNESP
jgi:hypothetical protein